VTWSRTCHFLILHWHSITVIGTIDSDIGRRGEASFGIFQRKASLENYFIFQLSRQSEQPIDVVQNIDITTECCAITTISSLSSASLPARHCCAMKDGVQEQDGETSNAAAVTWEWKATLFRIQGSLIIWLAMSITRTSMLSSAPHLHLNPWMILQHRWQ